MSALAALAHEAVHVRQSTLGAPVLPDLLVEAQAECSGMQWLAYVAKRFGAGNADARSLARFYWLLRYPLKRQLRNTYARKHAYWSRDCRAGGGLDIRAAGSPPSTWPNGSSTRPSGS